MFIVYDFLSFYCSVDFDETAVVLVKYNAVV